MTQQQNAILITGGGSGIGLETAKLFAQKGNRVIITGRNEAKLRNAVEQIGEADYIVSDITDASAVDALVARLENEYPDLNILINNAGLAYAYDITTGSGAYDKAAAEMTTNYLATVRLTEKLLPLLESQEESAIVNVSSIVAFAPSLKIPSYSASKAALHSYTQSLRLALQSTSVKVFEVMPPLVDTEFAKELSGNKIPASQVASEIVKGLEQDNFEIHVAVTADLYRLFLSSPLKALHQVNGIQG